MAAAICHAGMEALPLGTPALNGEALRPAMDADASVPFPLLTDAGFGPSARVGVALTGAWAAGAGVDACATAGVDGARLCEDCGIDGVEEDGFMRCPINFFKLFNSAFNSCNLASVLSFCPSIAFGIKSFSPLTSSVMRRDSSSRLRDEVLRSARTDSTSARAASRRSVRDSSAVLSASVSLESWSRREKACSKESSMAFLSCSSCGGVGGAIRGIT